MFGNNTSTFICSIFMLCLMTSFTLGKNLVNEIDENNISNESYLNHIDVPNTCVIHPVSRKEVISILF